MKMKENYVLDIRQYHLLKFLKNLLLISDHSHTYTSPMISNSQQRHSSLKNRKPLENIPFDDVKMRDVSQLMSLLS